MFTNLLELLNFIILFLMSLSSCLLFYLYLQPKERNNTEKICVFDLSVHTSYTSEDSIRYLRGISHKIFLKYAFY